MRIALILLLAALGGCAMNPADLREKGVREQFVMSGAPSAAAGCVARNVESGGNAFTGSYNTSVRDGAKQGTVELVVFGGTYYYLTADFAPAERGSLATTWASSSMVESARSRIYGAFKGC